MGKTYTIGILNSGGDCAGLNGVISAIVKTGSSRGHQFIGFEKGWEGLLDPPMYRPLTRADIRGISHLGGTILRTTNRGRFAGKTGTGNTFAIPKETIAQAKANLESLGVDGLIVIGGDGTLSAAMQLADAGVNIIGVPKSIDNDLSSTDKTFGFSTAVEVATSALDKIHTTAASHDRTIIVECMGRAAGWIALYAGLAGGADAILLPEFDYEVRDLVAHLLERETISPRSGIVVIAEGAKVNGLASYTAHAGSTKEVHYRGVSELLMQAIEAEVPGEFEMRNVVLGHTQRGGAPNAEDRLLAKRYGIAALEAFEQNVFGHMVSLKHNRIQTVPIQTAVSKLKLVSQDSYEYETAKNLGIFIH